jgi:protein tyrosine phosphatase (PTP) superfamily phosphohydrolase (DUF442 family)
MLVSMDAANRAVLVHCQSGIRLAVGVDVDVWEDGIQNRLEFDGSFGKRDLIGQN